LFFFYYCFILIFMKQKAVNDKPVTKAEMDGAFEEFHFVFKGEVEELLIQFRSDMFTRFDEIIGELAQGREDRLFIDHNIAQLKETDEDHEARLKELENNQRLIQ